jgi:ATP-dependent RNA helicase RhlE
VHELGDPKRGLTLVFVRTKRGADRLVKRLGRENVHAVAMHGDKSQSQREKALARFESGKVDTLVATDVAARGIDVSGVTHVINYDAPAAREDYVHRIGRTARAGAEGTAISFCDAEEAAFLRDIEKLIRMTIPATGRRGGGRPPQSPVQPHRVEAAAGPKRSRRSRRAKREQYAGAAPASDPGKIASVSFMRRDPMAARRATPR